MQISGADSLALPASVTNKVSPVGPRPADWFSNSVAHELARLVDGIEKLQAPRAIRNFFWVAFSSLILARSSVANARDIIHSRHHRFTHAHEPKVIERFHRRVGYMRRQIREFATDKRRDIPRAKVRASMGDARRAPSATKGMKTGNELLIDAECAARQ
jgi:hypothetical protein